MEQRVFHGDLSPADLAQALLAAFNRGNLRAQILGKNDQMAVQIATRPGARSGGQTALTVSIQKVTDGVLVQLGQQAWMGVAASLGQTAFAALRNPFSLLNRLDDLAQDIENLQLSENVWEVIAEAARAAGASYQLSERLARLTCEYCGTANPVGEPSCIACGAPLGDAQPRTCPNCGYVVTGEESICPNCRRPLAA
ncbi:MAG: zinc ribbon domain-containing protein [Chloroflexi bacterium]|nr:zinc ribbon domain-containing protein [Chloroflexota bacterium]